MKRLTLAALIVVLATGCSGGDKTSSPTATSESPPATTATAAAAGCTASGLDAMTALADFQVQMNDAQKAGKFSVGQLMDARNTLFEQTQAAQAKEDWGAYCKAIDDMRVKLGM